MVLYIRFLGLLISEFYFYLKIAKKKYGMIETIISVIFINVMALVTKSINEKTIIFTIPILLITFIIHNVIFDNTKKTIIVAKSIISFALSYAFYIVAAIITTVIIFTLPFMYIQKYGFYISFVIQMILIQVPFSFNRTHNGMSFLDKNYYVIGCILLGIMMIITAFYINSSSENMAFVLLLLVVVILMIFIFIYWSTSITRHYLERLSLRNIDSLNDELDEKNEYIKRLLEDKERLEKLNHKNYKLIPALQGAVMHYLEGVSTFIEINADNPALAELAAAQEINMKEFITEGNRLMNDIKELQSEWKEMVDSDDIEGIKEVPKCGVTRVDYLLSYTYERSKKENFSFRADVDSDLSGITEKIISEADLATLIADLIENAIIATKYNDGKDILVRMGIMKKEYVIEIYDSGVKFDKDVLLKYGVEKITTHADDNGSGIGMMQTYEILNNCGASIYIDELSDKSGLFTKRISIVFNKKNQYVLYTKRDDDEVAYLHKRSDLLIIKK